MNEEGRRRNEDRRICQGNDWQRNGNHGFFASYSPKTSSLQTKYRSKIMSNEKKQIFQFTDPEPWPTAVEPAELLREIMEVIRAHVVLSAHAAVALAVWGAHDKNLQFSRDALFLLALYMYIHIF
jgi:hypothetical protein